MSGFNGDLVAVLPDLPGAVCASVDPEVFFEAEGHRGGTVAKTLCANCPERAACAAYAIADPGLLGVWGGLTATERKDIRNGRDYVRAPQRPTARHIAMHEALRERSRQRAADAVAFHEAGMTPADIADHLGLHPDTVKRFIREARNDAFTRTAYEVERRATADARGARCVELHAQGTSVRAVADHLGIAYSTAARYVAKAKAGGPNVRKTA